MKNIKLVRYDINKDHDPIYYYDRYLITQSECNVAHISFADILDIDGTYGMFIKRNYNERN